MTDKEFYAKIEYAKSSHDYGELFKLTKERSFYFFERMTINELKGYDKLPIYIAAIKLKELYSKLLSKEEIETAEEIAEHLLVGGEIIQFNTSAAKAGDNNGL
ncbi:MAG: hypothetical protein ACI4JK_02205 [Oscillospiraceae bacterium]